MSKSSSSHIEVAELVLLIAIDFASIRNLVIAKNNHHVLLHLFARKVTSSRYAFQTAMTILQGCDRLKYNAVANYSISYLFIQFESVW